MKITSILSVASAVIMAMVPSDVRAGGSKPVVVEGKIKTVVLLVMENRSFDNFLGYWARTRQGVDGMPVDACNTITATGKRICAQDTAIYINKDPNHETVDVTEQIYGAGVDTLNAAKKNAIPTMGGFADVNARTWETTDPSIVRQAMDGYNPRNVPITAALASEFAVFDHPLTPTASLSTLLPPMVATKTASAMSPLASPRNQSLVPSKKKGLTWKNYHGQIPTSIFMKDARQVSKIKTMPTFYSDAKEGKLPNFSLIDPILMSAPGVEPNDNHPPHNVARGELLVKNIYEALRQSPQWNETLFLITYDENGGFYDHVAPPSNVPIPDDASAASTVFRHDRLGARVPTLAISPWIKKGRVVTKPNGPTPTSEFEHSSISATLKNIFKLNSFLTKRDAWAGTFDFLVDELSTPRTDAAWTLPNAPAIDQAFARFEKEDADSVEEYEMLKVVMDKLVA
ncbi:phosphoesterase family-domain-containing protein [Chytridium lagenaria]|nr:phosphoesterase family-domain-containing protein [Chytridium lagenaria]